ncbi:hypothetical protein LCGC14_2721950 [marine sediment metagenome]|uniref:Uncharacterized protein n=1 Tax=marine sediment metagenome TaxID=412755 RepID=A0A0F8ZXF5_9ZZZZ
MSHFYGTLAGQAQTTATRRGSKNSGITVVAASWNGAVEVDAYERDGEDRVRVSFIQWQNGAGSNRLIYDGLISGKNGEAS